MKTILKFIGTVCGIFLPQLLFANTYTVTNTADSGPGSLRQAILDANARIGADVIQFSIGATGNLFEGTAPNSYAVIEVLTALPAITDPVTIDGTTQTNTNQGSLPSLTVGVDNVAIKNTAYPDVYIVPAATYVFPSVPNGITGNGISIDALNVTIKGICISGFGNTNTNGGNASGHADIAILRSPTSRTVNCVISDCFISCDPLGNFPTAAQRKTKSNGILVLGNNETGTISNNYIAYSGTYGIHFNGNTDNLAVGPSSTTIGNRYWTITNNRLKSLTTNSTISAITRVNDGINLMKCVSFLLTSNYISDVEQTGIDIGYNSDSNYVVNNTITGIIKTSALTPQAGMRIGLCSEKDSLVKNVIANNTGSNFKAGIWIDRSTLVQTGVVPKDNADNLIQQNQISGNNGSGIVLSTNSTGGCYNIKITKNSIYSNVGLGIDLNFIGTSGTTLVTTNDDSDLDTGPNNTQNFPIIDSVRKISPTQVMVYGKAPAGATLEFFLTDGEDNTHGGRLLNYGEGKTFLGSIVEGSAQDLRSGTGAYNLDGNISTADNLFSCVLTYSGVSQNDYLTSTATVGNNTSEFGPTAKVMTALAVQLQNFTAVYADKKVRLNWTATSDEDFIKFEVEHSSNGRDFSSLGTVLPNTNLDLNYQFIQAEVAAGKHFYRLQMVNRDGKIQYSTVLPVIIRTDAGENFTVVNSTFTDRVNLRLNVDAKTVVTFYLLNQNGQLVKKQIANCEKGSNYIQLDGLENLPAGSYILDAQYAGEIISKKLVRNK